MPLFPRSTWKKDLAIAGQERMGGGAGQASGEQFKSLANQERL
jgi:hypothetical protein